MFLSPNRRARRSVLFILVVCTASVALAGIYKSQPVASASASRKTTAAPRALENSVLTPASTIVVNSTADVQNSSDGLCTLREAITAANNDTASGATAGECVAGSGSDTIDLTGVSGTITLTSALPFIISDATINGPGANQLTVARSTAGGTPRFRIFAVSVQGPSPTVNISGLSITNGHTVDGANGAEGGGISNNLGATLNLTNLVIHGNTTGSGDPGTGGSGGGVFNFGSMTITSSTISGNTTGTGGTDPGAFGGYGGGIFNAGTLTLINTTVSGNTTGEGMNSSQGGYGGGLYNTINRTVTLSNCTVSDNQAGTGGLGGGIRNEGTANLKDTIVANNAVTGSGTGPDLSGNFDSQDFNLIESISGASFTGVTTHNITGVDPLLGSLGSYGGSTSTHPLLFGSPAIDAANSSLTTDQRGQPRPIDDINASNAAGGNVTDIGAFEAHSFEVNSTADTSDGLCTGVGTGNGCTLREAITAANSEFGAELITFAPSLTAGGPAEITLLNTLPNLASDMIIAGPGASQLTVKRSTAGGTPAFRIFHNFSTVGIYGLTITNGKTPDGSPGTSGTHAEKGGGILNAGTLTLTDVNLTGNRTGVGGAGLNFGGFGGYGGALANTGTVTMTDCNVTGNITGNGGAGNASVGDGGRGGGIYNENNLTMTNCSVNENTTGDSGTTAGVGGRGGEGGGIYSRIGVLTLTNVTVNNNVTGSVPVGNGGNNAFSGSGGGIETILGIATLTNCTISGNQTGTTANGGTRGYGGAISNACPMTIIGTTISNNTGNDGAILNRRPLVITNSTLSGNHSIGINNSDSTSTLTLTNSTIAANDGFGVSSSAPSPTVRNSIIAGNASNTGDVSGNFTSHGHNLIGVGEGGGIFGSSGFTNGVNNDQVGSSASPLDARLAALGNYGGLTQTHALLPGSPALNAGSNALATNAGLTTDQRGFARITNTTVDIGSFESRGFTIAANSGTPQSAPITMAFGSSLTATVSSAFGEPVAGGAVSFTAPASGASGTFPGSVTTANVTINASGLATAPVFTANGIAGSYNVVASLAGGSPSANFSLTNLKANQTITFNALADKTFGNADFNVSATATSGLAVSFTASGQCTISGTLVHITGTGSCTITAKQAGDTNYNPAPEVPRLFNILKANQTITFNALADKTFGNADFNVSATATSGLAVSFTASGQCTISGTLVHLTSAGSCTISATQAGDTNYNPAPEVPRLFNIAKANQTITFNALADKTFGNADFNVSATATSGLAVSFTASGQCTISGTLVHLTSAGSCTISATQAGDTNYNPAPDVPRLFNIAKANQTITFNALADKTFGNADFNVSATATSGLAVSFTASGQCTISGTLVHITAAGSCTITAKQAGNDNYNAAPDVPRAFTVDKANQTITFNALADKTFGNADFNVSATASSGLALSFTASGQCTISGTLVHLTSAGSCTISATQAGDTNYNPAPDVPRLFTIAKAATTTTVSSSVNPSEFGQSVTFTATVTSSAGTPTGTVQFKDGATNVGSGTLIAGVAQVTTSSLSSGSHTITAEYGGEANFLVSTGTLPDGQVVKPQPTLSINDVSVTEGHTGTSNLTFTVTLSAASNLTLSAGYSSADGSGTLADNDYQSTSGTVTFNPGESLTKTVTVLVNGDHKTESDETVFVVLSNPVNAAFSDSQATGTILNDDTLQLLLDPSGPDANQLAAVDSLLLTRDPFRVSNTAAWFTSDQNTHLILFALNLQLGFGESSSVVKITLVDGNGQPHEVPAEDVRSIADTAFTQVTFRLPDGLATGTCLVTIKAHERISNTGTFRIVP